MKGSLSACLLAGMVLASSQAMATTYTFNVTSGDWSTPANWIPNGVPTTGDVAIIPSGKTAIIDSTAESIAKLEVDGTLEIRSTGTLTMNAGSAGASEVDGIIKLIVGTSNPSSQNPRIMVDSDLTFNGTGTIQGIDDGDPNSYWAGWLWNIDGTTSRVITIGSGVTIKGSINVTTTLVLDGDMVVDNANDSMFIGFSAFPKARLGGSGNIYISAGRAGLDFNDYSPTGTWTANISGGTFIVTAFIAYHKDVPGDFIVTGGTLQIDTDFCATGDYSIRGAEVNVAAGKVLRFTSTCPS